jgi:4-amino-4-deoxy-L-arabinose transferase-like glycosyltransferase
MNPVSNQNKPSDRRYLKLLLLLLATAFLLRIFLVIFPEVIRNDGAEYVRCAKQIASGNWKGSKAPPFYPVLIVLASRLAPNFELAGIWVSVILGTLLLIPVFYLGKEIFNERVGLLAALFAMVQPFLYLYSGSVLTESTYHFLMATTVLLGWYAFREGRFLHILLFSLLTALGYLTRPEAIGFLFVFSFWVLFIPPPEERRQGIKRVGIAFLAILLFLVFSFPYLLQIREDTGRWGITKKFSISVGSLSDQEEVQSLERITRTKKIHLVSFVKEPLIVLKKIGVGWVFALYKFQLGFNPLLFFFAIPGFILNMRSRSSRKGGLYLLSYFIFHLGFLLPFFWIDRRYASHLITLALPWAALGFIGLAEWTVPRLKEGMLIKKIPTLLLILVLVALFVQGRVTHGREQRLIQREIGLWMKDHLPKEAIFMSRLPQEAFYAEMAWIIMPDGNYEEMMQIARSKGIRYFIVDDQIKGKSPDFLEKIKEEDLVRVRDWKRKAQWSILFEVLYPVKQ